MHFQYIGVMSSSPSSTTSAQTANSARKTAEKQMLILNYFESQGSRPKRSRRNLEDSEYAQEPAPSEAQSVAVEEQPCQIVPASDDKHDCPKSDTRVEVEGVPVCVTSSISHAEQSDSDSCDFISPSPIAASSNNSLTLCGRMKRASDEHIRMPTNVGTNAADQCDLISPSPIAASSNNSLMLSSKMKGASDKRISTPTNVGTIAADRSEMSMRSNSTAPDESTFTLQILKRFDVRQFYHTPTSEHHQPNVKMVDRHDTAHHVSRYHFSESDEDVQNSAILSTDIPSPSDADAEFSSKFPVAEVNIDDIESYPLESDQKPTRRQFMEKVISVLSF